MFRRGLALGCFALTCLTTSGAAQSVAPLRLGVGFGTSFDRASSNQYGAHGVLSLTSQPAGSRLAVRAEMLFDGAERILQDNGGLDPTMSRRRTLGLIASPTYRLWGDRTGLYAIAGLGLYYSWGERERLYRNEVHRSSATDLGVNVGLGFDFKAFGRYMFIESRLHTGPLGGRVPVTLGIRF